MKCTRCHKEAQDDAVFCPYCGEKFVSAPSAAQYEYSAFISYRHVPHDQEVAKKIQKAIESYKMPRGVNAQGRTDNKLGKCFRDEDELVASASLPDRILDALRKSSALVVVCSPDACQSTWIEREVKAFIEMHGRERVFTVLADGDSSKSVPEYLKTSPKTDDGTDATDAHPLSADLRPEASSKAKDEILRIIAAIAGCGFDDLRQREALRRRKRRTTISVAAALAVALVAVMLFVAVQGVRDAQINESLKLAQESENLLEHGDRYGAIEKALEALPDSDSPLARPYVENARQALVDALEIDPVSNIYWRPSYSIELDDGVSKLIVEPEHGWFAIMSDSLTVSTFDCETGKKLTSFSLLDLGLNEQYAEFETSPLIWDIMPAGEHVIVREGAVSGIFACYDIRTGELKWNIPYACMDTLAVTPDGNYMSGFVHGSDYISGVYLDVASEENLHLSQAEQMPKYEIKKFFHPVAINEQGVTYGGIGTRIFGFDASEENPPLVVGEAGDLEILSIIHIEDTMVASSASILDEYEKTPNVKSYDFCFEGIDRGANTRWSYRDSWTYIPEGRGTDVFTVDMGPMVHGALTGGANHDETYALCSVGDELLIFANASGELVFSKHFGSGILTVENVDILEDTQEDMVAVVCANGTVNMLSPFAESSESKSWLGFSLPDYVNKSYIGRIDGSGLMTFAVSIFEPHRVYCYHLDARALMDLNPMKDSPAPTRIQGEPWLMESVIGNLDKPASSYSLEELIERAHTVLSDAGRE